MGAGLSNLMSFDPVFNAVVRAKFTATMEAVARELIDIDYHSGAAFVRTPVIYPSGSNAVVRVTQLGVSDTFFVTDLGLGYQEAELMGSSLIYARHARTIAENAGINFDSEAFFVAETSRDQLAGAIATVANCSQEAVALAAYKIAERRASDLGEELYERLIRIFTPPKVAKNVAIFGASNVEHHVSAMVTIAKRPAIFEPVANHPTSIAFANSKFHDLALLEQPPIQIAVVRKKKELGTYLNLLGQVAHVIETDVSDDRISRLARAA
jgi:hypothetical protein